MDWGEARIEYPWESYSGHLTVDLMGADYIGMERDQCADAISHGFTGLFPVETGRYDRGQYNVVYRTYRDGTYADGAY